MILVYFLKQTNDFVVLQYIITLIDSDLPKEKPNIIEKNDICLRLNDKDNKGKLFLNSF